MTEIDDLARFYGELYRALKKQRFNAQQALRIILKEAKIPRTKGKKKEDMGELIENAIRRIRKPDSG